RPANAVRFGDGRLPAGVEHLAEYEVVDRRPPPIRLFDPFAVDVPHAPALHFLLERLGQLPRVLSCRGTPDEAAAEHARLPRWRIIEHAGLSGRDAFFARDQLDLVTTVRAAQPGRLRRAGRAHAHEQFEAVADG